jgi:hypothetical protein
MVFDMLVIAISPLFLLVGVRVARSLVFCVMSCRSLFVPLSFLFWPLCCLFFFDRGGHDHMVFGFTTTYTISVYNH